jgi:endonuclease/exonuclease/phosphatase family metal-dependent hydrolase
MTPHQLLKSVALLTVSVALLLAARAAGNESPTVGPGAALRVMSFNIRNSASKDGINAWPRRRDLFFQQIESFGPALIGFQEVLADQYDDIVSRMKEHAFVGVARDDGKRRGEWALLGFRRDRFEKIASGDFWLSENPEAIGSKSWDAALTRICTWCRLRDRVTGRDFLYANTHFDHKGIVAREQSARLLVAKLTELAQGKPVVLTGDLNVNEDTSAYAVITRPQGNAAAWLLDAYRVVHPQRLPDEASFHGFKGTRTGSRIDFVFHSATLKPLAATIEQVDANDGRYPSDHYAVTAVLEFVAPASTATQ